MLPVQVAVLPLSRKDTLDPTSRRVWDMLRPHFRTQFDDAQSIGRRYRRQDEIGTPYCITVDFDSLEDHAVEIGDGPGKGKRVVLIAADQEYRSEYSQPMLARLLAKHHGFHCTVLFSLNQDNDVDPTQKIRWEDKTITHNIPGLEHLASADLLILFSRLLSLPAEQLQHVYDYLDSGKPLIGIRTANHGFIEFEYRKNGKKIDPNSADVVNYVGYLDGKFVVNGRTMEDYFQAKARLFTMAAATPGGRLIINADDTWGRRLIAEHKSFLWEKPAP